MDAYAEALGDAGEGAERARTDIALFVRIVFYAFTSVYDCLARQAGFRCQSPNRDPFGVHNFFDVTSHGLLCSASLYSCSNYLELTSQARSDIFEQKRTNYEKQCDTPHGSKGPYRPCVVRKNRLVDPNRYDCADMREKGNLQNKHGYPRQDRQ